MKNLLFPMILMFLALASSQVNACDEECKRKQAMEQHNVEFPSYMTAKFCETTSVDFLLRDYASLQKYRTERLPTGHKGGMNNIRKMLDQRKEWLVECDDYLRLTGQGRVFYNAETTKTVFDAMDKVTKELNALVYNGSQEVIVTNGIDIIEQDFDKMLSEMDQHKTNLQLRGQLVIR
ncbi:hypothetical protein [Gilvimarinus polysaccharolyticus]|uniref:hypothetical protein n=1 Tax=Gilvimarinus polysaccharolyticus TaxID=863921 RepID=UPI000673AED5|nr:hypothetical protein [Gilvimarinus polysaccharolyticus]